MKAEQEEGPPDGGYRDGSLLRYYRAVNESYPTSVSYVLGDRGFFAEVTTVARAMIYAWCEHKQLVLESADFAYRTRDGWTDYFEPFCPAAAEIPAAQIEERFRFTLRGDRDHFMKLRAFDPGSISFGIFRISGIQPMIRHFMRLLFRLSYDTRRGVDALRDRLALPSDYVAVHVRRGDKVGDEDVSYPVGRYFREIEDLGEAAVFVMSDDYGAVEEVSEYLASRRLANRVLTLCRPDHRGFDVWKLRASEGFAGGCPDSNQADGYRRYVWEETTRLLAETFIAARAARFVSTLRSNVGKTVWYLHETPAACRLIG
jgi:hypothetical protein